MPTDPASTNLYGAILSALQGISADEGAYRTRNLGGAFTAGHIVVFTDGKDTAGSVTEAQVKAAAVRQPNDQVWVVGLHSADYDGAAISRIASSPYTVLESDTAAQLSLNFLAIASRIAGQASQTYYLGYCSPKRSGTHSVALTVAGSTGADTKTAQYPFNASGFSSTCSAQLLQDRCFGRECGGLACGGCDDRTDGCVGTSYQCVNYCEIRSACGDNVITNVAGYSQTCPNTATREDCNGTCLNPASYQTDIRNCGTCGNVCPFQAHANTTCNGMCGNTCSNGYMDCDLDPLSGCEILVGGSDRSNCGDCNSICVGTCTTGMCSPILTSSRVSGMALDSQNLYWITPDNTSTAGSGSLSFSLRKIPKGGGGITILDSNIANYDTIDDLVYGSLRITNNLAYWAQTGTAGAVGIFRVPTGGGARALVATSSSTFISPKTFWKIPRWPFVADDTFVYSNVESYSTSTGTQSPSTYDMRKFLLSSGANTIFSNAANQIEDDANNIYFSRTVSGVTSIYSSLKSGQGAVVTLVTGMDPYVGFVLNGSTIYYWNNSSFYSIPVAGGAPTLLFATSLKPDKFVGDGLALYWYAPDQILRKGTISTATISEYHSTELDSLFVTFLAADSGYLYWSGCNRSNPNLCSIGVSAK